MQETSSKSALVKRKKKNLELWQFIIVMVLLAMMFFTMFLPAFRFDTKALHKMNKNMEQIVKEDPEAEILQEIFEPSSEEEWNEALEEVEKEIGVSIETVSPLKIMTHNFLKNVPGASMAFNLVRVGFWISYIILFILIALNIFGYCFKWNKVVTSIINLIYAVFTAIYYGYCQFGLVRVSSKISVSLVSEIEGSLAGLSAKYLSKIMGSFWSVSFLISFIGAILLLSMSIVCMTKGREYEEETTEIEEDDIETETETETDVSDKRQAYMAPPKKVEGIVACIKGVAMGQGRTLPGDRKVIIGKDPRSANLCINHPHISNIHCSIRFNPENRTYIIKDHSMNGTFVNGTRLPKEMPVVYPAGTVLSLADGSTEIGLG